jgi:acyl-CoA hydrolase
MDISLYKPVNFSQTTLTELMIPSYANFGGKIHGGIILSLMDKIAYVCASKHAGSYCVTASIDTVNFMQPVEVGDLVSLMASVNYVNTREIKHTNTSYFTMIAMNDDYKPVEVPGLILENQKQVSRFLEALKRKAIRQNYRSEMEQVKKNISSDKNLGLLQHERCVIIPG